MFETNIQPSDNIIRYMSFDKFMYFLCTSKIYFPRADSFDDVFEGSFTKLNYQAASAIDFDGEIGSDYLKRRTIDLRKSAYVSCWTLSAKKSRISSEKTTNDDELESTENMALWQLFGGKNSVAIETTINELETAINNHINNSGLNKIFNKEIVKVDYINHKSIDITLSAEFLEKNNQVPLTKKSKAYEYENEVRAIISHAHFFGSGVQGDLTEKLGEGINLNISLKHFIKKIYVSPIADRWFFDTLQILLEPYDLKNLLIWSAMRLPPSHSP